VAWPPPSPRPAPRPRPPRATRSDHARPAAHACLASRDSVAAATPVETPLAFTTAAGPLPGAAGSASSTLACVSPARRRLTACGRALARGDLPRCWRRLALTPPRRSSLESDGGARTSPPSGRVRPRYRRSAAQRKPTTAVTATRRTRRTPTVPAALVSNSMQALAPSQLIGATCTLRCDEYPRKLRVSRGGQPATCLPGLRGRGSVNP
jgi:hypothetical protein